MYRNTGRGGMFFENIYDWFWFPEIRKEPATKDDFLKAKQRKKKVIVFVDYESWFYSYRTI